MEDKDGYAVYFFPPALEALGEAIKPFLMEGPGGVHVLCRRIDTAGALIGMGLDARNASDQMVQLELMVPTNMVRMIVSARSDEAFGFGPRRAAPVLPPVGPEAMPAEAPPQTVPGSGDETDAGKTSPEAKPRKSKAASKAKPAKKASAPRKSGSAKPAASKKNKSSKATKRNSTKR